MLVSLGLGKRFDFTGCWARLGSCERRVLQIFKGELLSIYQACLRFGESVRERFLEQYSREKETL